MKTHDDWRQTLAPWLTALQDRLWIATSAMPTREEMEDLWITFEVDDESEYEPTQWTRILEAFELLDLLVRVDANIGWDLVFSIARHSGSFLVNAAVLFPRHKVRPRYVFESLDSEMIRNNFQTVFLGLRRMIGEDDQPWEPPTPEFPPVKQLLLDTWKMAHDDQEFDRACEGRIEVQPHLVFASPNQLQPVPFMVQHTLALAEASRELLPPHRLASLPHLEVIDEDNSPEAIEHRQIRNRRAVFCFVSLAYELVSHPVTNEVLYYILLTAKQGLPITDLVVDQVLMPHLHFSVAGTFFMNLLGVWRSRGKASSRFEFSCGRFDLATVGAVCSALALSGTVTEFAFTKSGSAEDEDDNMDGQDDRGVWWPWLAYALFSRDAKHHIKRVRLDIQGLTMAHIGAMRTVLEHPNPLAHVCALDEPLPRRPVLSTAPTAAILKPQTRVAIGHRIQIAHEEDHVDRGTANITANVPHPIVRNNEDENFLEIVFPGSGVSWINRADVEEIQLLPRRDESTIKVLELDPIQPEAKPVVLELLRLVGGMLEELSLSSADEPMDDAFMRAVCSICPQLTCLKIDGAIESVCWLVTSAESGTSNCRLERIELLCEITDHTSVLALFKALSDGDHNLSRSLRALLFREQWGERLAQGTLTEIANHWLGMLRANWRLERCEFVWQQASEATAAHTDQVRKLNGQRIFLPVKLAFLSVLTDPRRLGTTNKRQRIERDELSSSVRYQLPRETVELILDMADIPQRRICA